MWAVGVRSFALPWGVFVRTAVAALALISCAPPVRVPTEVPELRAPAPTVAPRDPTHEPPDEPPRVEPQRSPALAGDPPYDRHDWPHWIDADHDCQDTRTEALVAASEIPVTFVDDDRCEVASGRWRCPYTDAVVTDPRKLDVDHLVPLAEAHRSGGARWSKQRKTEYANDLADREHLIVVLAHANRSKGSRTITEWLPDEPGFRCEYVEAWLRVKHRWQLAVAAEEAATAEAFLVRCRAGDVPALVRERIERVERPSAASHATCCRVCKAGKPCGDGCIAADKTCHKPTGCACGVAP